MATVLAPGWHGRPLGFPWSAAVTGTLLSERYGRIARRRGKAKAQVAVAGLRRGIGAPSQYREAPARVLVDGGHCASVAGGGRPVQPSLTRYLQCAAAPLWGSAGVHLEVIYSVPELL
jgi:hypothetical protein